jgi:hypothetical protein
VGAPPNFQEIELDFFLFLSRLMHFPNNFSVIENSMIFSNLFILLIDLIKLLSSVSAY